MSDSLRQIGDCRHGRPRQYCGTCELEAQLAKALAAVTAFRPFVECAANMALSEHASGDGADFTLKARKVLEEHP